MRTEQEILTQWADAQKTTKMPCPRCGRWNMRTELCANAFSRRADIYICPECGNAEALEDLAAQNVSGYDPTPLRQWAAVQLIRGNEKNDEGSAVAEFRKFDCLAGKLDSASRSERAKILHEMYEIAYNAGRKKGREESEENEE